MKKYLLKVIFSANDGEHENHSVECSEEDLEQEIDNNMIAITTYQDAMVEKWEKLFEMEASDRQIYNKIDADGYYQDGYLFMRKIDMKRGYFEGRLEVSEVIDENV